MNNKKILIIDDETSILELLQTMLEEDYDIITFSSGEKALKEIKTNNYDLVISDLRIIEDNGQETSGLDILKEVKNKNSKTPVIIITAYSDVESGLQSIEWGAYEYISKPFKIQEIREKITKAFKESDKRSKIPLHIIGNSPKMRDIINIVEKIKDTNANVLITGESGVGKEIISRIIHFTSIRKDKPFVPVNCGAIPSELLESELFGYKKGAFTGATHDKIGLFKMANSGTIFLDEVGELPLDLQVKLLRVLQDKKIRPVGSVNDELVDVRIIAATNKDLLEHTQKGLFREDLYYRLNVIHIEIPPLRERREDIIDIINYTLNRLNRELNKNIMGLTPISEKILLNYSYPGNIRELINIIERAAILENDDFITPATLPPEINKTNIIKDNNLDEIDFTNFNMDDFVANIEKQLIKRALIETEGIKVNAAKLLGISFRSFRYRLKKYGMSDDTLSD